MYILTSEAMKGKDQPSTDYIHLSVGFFNLCSTFSNVFFVVLRYAYRYLVYCSASPFQTAPTQMRTALSMVTDASDVLSVLLASNHSVIAGRLLGASAKYRY